MAGTLLSRLADEEFPRAFVFGGKVKEDDALCARFPRQHARLLRRTKIFAFNPNDVDGPAGKFARGAVGKWMQSGRLQQPRGAGAPLGALNATFSSESMCP